MHIPHEPIYSFLMRNAFVFLSDSGSLIFYTVLSVPLFLIARIRYAVTGRATSFFRIFANTGFGLRHFWGIMVYFALSYALRFAFAAVLLFTLPLLSPQNHKALSHFARSRLACRLCLLTTKTPTVRIKQR